MSHSRYRMNCEEFVVPPLELALPVVKESLRCLLHTILFSRSIGGDVPVEPVTIKSETLGLSYCRANHASGPDMGQVIENKIREFSSHLETSDSLCLVLSFFVPRHGKKSLWDILSQPFDDRAVFERWKIQVDVTRAESPSYSPDEMRSIESASMQTKDRVFYIIKRVNERMDHLPPPPNDQPSYHFDISFAPCTRSARGSQLSSPTTPSMWSPKSIAQSIRSIPFIT